MNETTLPDLARQARIDALTMIYHATSGHPGGSLSCIDLLTYLYFRGMNLDAANPTAANRDRLVLSKGHACPALYAVGALKGLIPRQELSGFRKIGRSLQGHPHVALTPMAETSTGSLGQGFSAALGMALGLRHQGVEANCYAVLGDGEMQEGEVWEGAMFAAHHKLHRFCAILDYNKMQSDDLNSNIMGLEPLADKWRAFGWHVIEIDGHNFDEIDAAVCGFKDEADKPTMIIAHTIKGKGVDFMEGIPTWHGSVTMSREDLVRSLASLNVDEAQQQRRLKAGWEVA